MKKKNYFNKMKGNDDNKDIIDFLNGIINLEKCPKELINEIIEMAIRTGQINRLRYNGKGVSTVFVNIPDDSNLSYHIEVDISGKMTGVSPSGRKLNQDQCRQLLKKHGVIE